jgi:hypothetical protein
VYRVYIPLGHEHEKQAPAPCFSVKARLALLALLEMTAWSINHYEAK